MELQRIRAFGQGADRLAVSLRRIRQHNEGVDRVEVAGITRHPSHTTGRAVFSHPAVESNWGLTHQVREA